MIRPVSVNATLVGGDLSTPAVHCNAMITPLGPRIAAATATDDSLPANLPPAYTGPRNRLMFNGKRYVPPAMRAEVISLAHDIPSAGHTAGERTYEMVHRQYAWPGMTSDIKWYCKSCDKCQRSKTSRQPPAGRMTPLPVPVKPWSSISWDHIGPLPVSNGYDAILVIVDRMTKLAHFVPAKTTDTSEDLARQLYHEVVRLHGPPTDIVSDRGPTFKAGWFQAFCARLNIDNRYSTAYHPQTDGQTEKTHQTVEHVIRCHVDQDQDDWAHLLDDVEFAYNNSYHSAIRQSPFHATYGFHPNDVLSMASRHEGVEPTADLSADRHVRAHDLAKKSIEAARQRMMAITGRRSDAPEYAVDDEVLLSTKDLKIHQPSRKLADRFIGPFKITRAPTAENGMAPNTVTIDVGPLDIHPTVNVDRVKPYIDPNSFPGRPPFERPPPVQAEDGQEEEYEVGEIVDSRMFRRKVQYFVRWKGYGRQDEQWVGSDQFDDDDPVVRAFATAHPDKPTHIGPRRRQRRRIPRG